jgi:hypothetical protein
MRVVFTPTNVRKGLDQLETALNEARLNVNRSVHWSFSKGSQDEWFRTWSGTVSGFPFAIAIGEEGCWGTRRRRTPILIACAELREPMIPTVEINIPSDGRVNRRVQGCLCQGADKRFFLAHRGMRFTMMSSGIPKESIRQYFSDWLLVTDGSPKRKTRVIKIGYVGDDLVGQIAAFACRVAALKGKRRQRAVHVREAR